MSETDTKVDGARAADANTLALATELLEQARDYRVFAEDAGSVLGPHYRDLARSLCHRAAVLLGADDGSEARTPPDAAAIQPRDLHGMGEAWQQFLALVTARRAGISSDGAELLGGSDPGPALWVAVTAMVGVLNTVSEQSACTLLTRWGIHAAELAEGMPHDGR